MTIAPQVPIVTVQGNDITTSFNYNFEIPYQADGSTPAVLVYLQNGSQGTPVYLTPGEYSINGIDNPTGGTVTYPSSGDPLPTGWYITILRNLYYSNPFDFPNGPFLPEEIENMGDNLAMQIQQLALGTGTGGGGGGGSGVTSFNGRTGVVTLAGSDVTAALGYTPVNRAGDTMTGKLTAVASNSSRAGFRLPAGAAPTSPLDGDLWSTAAGVYAQINGVTVGPFGTGGGGSFDQSTPYSLGGSTVNRSLVQRGLTEPSIYDFGAVGDGVADDTDALNAMIAAVNAQTIRSLYFPAGTFLIEGNVTTVTRGCAIYGDGIDVSNIVGGGAGTSTLIPVSITQIGLPEGDRVTMADLSFASTQNFVRRVASFQWSNSHSASQQRLHIENIDIQKHFKEGIYIKNMIGGVFVAINMQGGPVVDGLMDWGWRITADVGEYSVVGKWVSCNVSTAERCWWVDHHAEGFYWTQCEAGFSQYGWYLDLDDDAGGQAPEFHITDCQCEVYSVGIWAKNLARLYVSDYSFYVGEGADLGATCIRMEKVTEAQIHNNMAVKIGSATRWNFVGVFGASTHIKCQGNQIGFLNDGSYGWVVADTTDYVQITGTYYHSVQGTTANPITISSSGTHIYESQSTTNSSQVQFLRKVGGGINSGGALAMTTSLVVAALASVPVWKGQQYRIQAQVSLTSVTANQAVSLRIREYTHRPSGPSPYTVFEVTNGLTTIFDITNIFSGKAGRFYIDTVVRIVGSATDAMFVLELGTSDLNSTADVYSLYVEMI